MRQDAPSDEEGSTEPKQHLQYLKLYGMAKYRRADLGSNSSFTTIAAYKGTCNCCCQPFLPGSSQVTKSWVGWIHQSCKALMISLNRFIVLQKRLHALSSTPAEAHMYMPLALFPETRKLCVRLRLKLRHRLHLPLHQCWQIQEGVRQTLHRSLSCQTYPL